MPEPRDRFVNPYTFVPLPAAPIIREAPPGHVEGPDEGRLTGSMTVEWKLRTPLLLPDNAQQEGWLRADLTVRIPGSAMKGAVRSLHETLFNGCLRVFDSSFVPGYRMPARSGADDADGAWVLAVVTRSRDGIPAEVAPCDGIEWIESTSLRTAYAKRRMNRRPRSGDIVSIGGDRELSALRQENEVAHVTSVSAVARPTVAKRGDDVEAAVPLEGQVLLITDTSARMPERRDGSPADCFWAAGVLGAGEHAVVPPETAQLFRAACDGSRDRQVLRQKEKKGEAPDWRRTTQYETVKFRGEPVGERALASGALHAGDVVWVRLSLDETTVEEMLLARLWRKTGEVPAGERVPPSLLPCWTVARGPARAGTDGPEGGLCLSCTIFGSADTSGERHGEGRQESYAGHVRIGSARSRSGVVPLEVRLAPLGSPRLGAGVFSLADHGTSEVPGDVASEWGSDVDTPTPRRLRGRKFYWHVDPDKQADFWSRELRRPSGVLPRYKARDHQSRKGLARDARLVPAGTVLTQEIAFEGLDEVALHSLLIAIDPGRLLGKYRPNRTFATHLGGGKPFGLGAATARIASFAMWPSSNRYNTGLPPLPEPVFDIPTIQGIQERVGKFERPRAIARLLDLDGLGDWRNHVAYPPGARWDEIDLTNRGFVPFDESFHFFKKANGQRLEGPPPYNRAWCPLPPIVGPDGSDARPDLPIDPGPGEGRR